MEPWLIAVVLRPFGALAFFGLAAFIAYKVIAPLIPEGRIKAVLFDRSLRTRHPWKFTVLLLVSVYGTILVMDWWYLR